jgi:hypothetical protein
MMVRTPVRRAAPYLRAWVGLPRAALGRTSARSPGDYQAGGGLAQFGRPLTEPFKQVLGDGREYEVQYFARARFEWHREANDGQGGVLLGQFGRRVLAEVAR